jgi:hypothetical protein
VDPLMQSHVIHPDFGRSRFDGIEVLQAFGRQDNPRLTLAKNTGNMSKHLTVVNRGFPWQSLLKVTTIQVRALWLTQWLII